MTEQEIEQDRNCHYDLQRLNRRASRGIPTLFFNAWKIASIESLNPQWQALSEVRRRAGKAGFYARHA